MQPKLHFTFSYVQSANFLVIREGFSFLSYDFALFSTDYVCFPILYYEHNLRRKMYFFYAYLPPPSHTIIFISIHFVNHYFVFRSIEI